MIQAMRWFGPADPVTLAAIRQAGAAEVVTALHEIPNGAVWPQAAIAARRAAIVAAGLDWTVVESLPVDDEIKRRGPAWDARIAAWCESLANLAACGGCGKVCAGAHATVACQAGVCAIASCQAG